jgi:hypothetical protein
MLGKNGIFRGKSYEKSFFQKIPRKKCTKNRPQIGRIFACWAIVYFGKPFINYRSGTNFGAIFTHGNSFMCVNFDKNGPGNIFCVFLANASGQSASEGKLS